MQVIIMQLLLGNKDGIRDLMVRKKSCLRGGNYIIKHVLEFTCNKLRNAVVNYIATGNRAIIRKTFF